MKQEQFKHTCKFSFVKYYFNLGKQSIIVYNVLCILSNKILSWVLFATTKNLKNKNLPQSCFL